MKKNKYISIWKDRENGEEIEVTNYAENIDQAKEKIIAECFKTGFTGFYSFVRIEEFKEPIRPNKFAFFDGLLTAGIFWQGCIVYSTDPKNGNNIALIAMAIMFIIVVNWRRIYTLNIIKQIQDELRRNNAKSV